MPQEKPLLTIHPVLIRRRPIRFFINLACLIGGIACLANQVPKPIFVAISILVGFCCLQLFRWWIGTITTSLILTPTQVIKSQGLISQNLIQMRHVNVQNIHVKQTILERLLFVGSVGFSSSGQADIEIKVFGIPNPREVAEKIQKVLDSPDSTAWQNVKNLERN